MTTEPTTTKEPAAKAAPKRKAAATPQVELPSALTIQTLASLISVEPVEIIKQLMRAGFMMTINDVVERDLAEKIATASGYTVATATEGEAEPDDTEQPEEEHEADLVPRAPVVTILGHVDHGKTTLLDRIRKSNVVDGEAGGITQHIGAYRVTTDGHTITFIDTPGHEAFTAMRARGAQVTDVAVLVVAADDGLMPQTLEAIDHIRAAEVPMIVAINKVDRPEADTDRVKRQLSEQNLLVEDWGGDVISQSVSALKGDGVDSLLESLMLVAEVEEFKANPNRPARAVVVEARVDKSKGPVATVLVQSGTLRVGDLAVAGGVRGKVKAMLDDTGRRVKEATPSVPVEVLGLRGLPEAGDILNVAEDEKSARLMTEQWNSKAQDQAGGVTLDEIYSRIEAGTVKALNLIVKTDVQGSLEAVRSSLQKLSNEETRINLLRTAAGSVSESDVLLAEASQAIIIGFNTGAEPGAKAVANVKGVEIRRYDIIYNLVDDVDLALKGLLEPEVKDILEGYATVRALFGVGKGRQAAGFYVNEGRLSRGASIRVMRAEKQLFEGPITSLKHFKDDVREVTSGLEGGITLEDFQDVQPGDILEAHRTETV